MTRQLAIQQPFNLKLTLTMGQAFRWKELPAEFYGDGHTWFSGVLGENLIHIRQTDDGVEYRVGGPDGERVAILADDEMLRHYFREDDDIATIYADLSRDPKMATIVDEHPGLRLLRQDPWECTVAYLCSANNNIKRISAIVEAVADNFGTVLKLVGEVRRTFPAAEQLIADSAQSAAKLKELRLGLKRARNIMAVAQEICTDELDLSALRQQPYHKVRLRLMQCSGIGCKIADCIALFSLEQMEAFPVDVWVWRSITQAYPEWGFPDKGQPTSAQKAAVDKYARHELGEYAGYANQYLFYWRRLYGEEPLPFGTRWRGKLRITPPDGQQLDDQYLDDLRYEYLRAKYLSC